MFHRLASGYTSGFHLGTTGNLGCLEPGLCLSISSHHGSSPPALAQARLALRAVHPSSSGDTSWSPGQDILKGWLVKGDNRAPHLPALGVLRVLFPQGLPLWLPPSLEGTEPASKVTSRDEQGASCSTQGRFGPNPCDILFPEREKNSRRQAGCGEGGAGNDG